MDKKLKAKHEMLKRLTKGKTDDMYKGFGDGLKTKKLQKVTVAAPDKEGLKKGLSMAEKLLAAKFGKSEVEDEDVCPLCDGEGCSECSDDKEESEEETSDEE
jgi:hypothetical protein